MKFYTIGEIYRKGLLKNHAGEPYKHKATISKIVNGMKYKMVKSPWGPGKAVSEEEIAKFNGRWS